MMYPPRNVNSYPRKNIRLVTLLDGSMRIVPPLKERVQGISRREWVRLKVSVPNLYQTHRPTA